MNKASGGDGIPVEQFQILKDDAVKGLHSICQQIWKTQQWPQDWKRSVFIPIPKKGKTKESLNYRTIALISHASKVMLKILQDRLQQYVNRELPDVQAGFRKGRGTRDQITNILWIIKKAREFQKYIYFCIIDYAKAFDCVDHNKLENSERDGNTRPPDLPFEKWHPTPVPLPGKSHGRRSLVGCSPWGREESDTTERLDFHYSLSCIGEGDSNPLQCSCLENPRDGEAWLAAVYGVAQSRTRLKRLSSSSSSICRSGSNS